MFPIPGVARGLEVTPVVVDGGLYVTAANEPKNGGWDAARQASPLSNKCLQKWRLSPNG